MFVISFASSSLVFTGNSMRNTLIVLILPFVHTVAAMAVASVRAIMVNSSHANGREKEYFCFDRDDSLFDVQMINIHFLYKSATFYCFKEIIFISDSRRNKKKTNTMCGDVLIEFACMLCVSIF